MKTLWLALSVIAISNLLALLGFVGWLKMSDRLDSERLKAVRTILAKTITEEKSETDEAARKEAAAKAEAEEAERKGRPPLTATEQLYARLEATEIDEQKIKAMIASIETLRAPLQAERDSLGRERAALERDKVEFQAVVDAANLKTKDEQFKKTVAVMDSLKAIDARLVLSEIMRGADAAMAAKNAADRAASADLLANSGAETTPPPAVSGGPSPAGIDRALDYLNAMSPRTRSKVVAEFVKEDPSLAGELLERLRAYGQVPIGAEKPTLVGSTQQ